MKSSGVEKHQQELPSARKIRRSCNRELYRALKKLKIWVPPEQIIAAEEFYFRKVIEHLPLIVEHHDNRKALCDWWDEHICPEVAKLWNVEETSLSKAFRSAFGG
ncbi:MAG TPA: dehydrogenase [Bacilli bacterium]